METQTEEKKSLVEVVETFALEPQTKTNLLERFQPFFVQAEDWEKKAKSLVVTDASQVREMQIARTARLALADIRINADKARKAMKEDSLRYGKAVQGVYNVIEYLIKPIEVHLSNQENFVKIQRENQIQARFEERLTLLAPLEIDLTFVDVKNMPEDSFKKFYEDQKAAKEARIQAEKQVEIERIAKEKAESEEKERIRIENERLKKEAQEREKALSEEKEKSEKIKKDAEEKARKLKAEADAKLKKEKEEREKAEAELNAKKEAEKKEKADRIKAEEKAASAPDKIKLLELAKTIDSIQLPEMKSKEGENILNDTKKLIEKLSGFIKEKAITL
jgi:hypothetical protein